MYNLLIVDDERMIRMGIKNAIPWNQIGIEQTFVAASGQEALDIMESTRIDIMITDINMTGLSGLELIEKIREKNHSVKIIVLTGYDNFEYARRCIRMQVEDFFLKPVDEFILKEAVRKQVDYLNDEKEEKSRESLKRRTVGSREQMKLEHRMRMLVHRKEQAIEEIYTEYGISKQQPLQVAIIVPELCMKEQEEEENFRMLSVKNICIGLIDEQNNGITFMDDEKIVMVIFNQAGELGAMEQIDELNNILKDEYNRVPKIVVGSEVDGLENAFISYNDAVFLLKHEKESIKEIIKMEHSRNKENIFEEIYQELKGTMCSNVANMEYMIKAFDTFAKATESYNLTTNYIRRSSFEIAASVYFSFLNNTGEETEGKLDALAKSLLYAKKKEALEVTREFLTRISRKEELNSHEIVSQAIGYIEQFIAEELSVTSIAEHFFITPNYFSRLFKRIMGEGCNEYIVKKRIEKAKLLLETTNIKAGKIAIMVGYHDTNYFSLAFKKHTGMSPTAYREEIRLKG